MISEKTMELRRSYYRKQKAGRLDEVTDEERAAVAEYQRARRPSPGPRKYRVEVPSEVRQLANSYQKKQKAGRPDEVTDEERRAIREYGRATLAAREHRKRLLGWRPVHDPGNS